MPADTVLRVADTNLKLSNLDKILYPGVGFTKVQVIDYYIRIAPVMLPHIRNHPMTLKRYPHGVEGKFFYQKECPASRPDWLHTTPVWSESRGKYMNYCLIDSLASLVWTAGMAALELHPSLSLANKLAVPAMLVFDLDPGDPATIVECAQVAVLLRELLAKSGLDAYPKTSGSKGIQVYVPLNSPADYVQTKGYALGLAKILEQQYPELVTAVMKKSLRTGKVFIDWSQNDEHKTTVAVYSLRAREKPSVSSPVTWQEIDNVIRLSDPAVVDFDSAAILSRVDQYGDLFEPVLTKIQHLPDI